MANETEQFLKDLDTEEKKLDVFETPLVPETEAPKEPEDDEDDFTPKNRRERRIFRKLEARGEETNRLAQEVVSLRNVIDAREARENTEEADYLKLVEKIYGTATPEAKEATETLKSALKGAYEAAKRDSLQESRQDREEERATESNEVAENERTLDGIMGELEDEHDVDFSDPQTRKGFLAVLEKLSPKDKEGNIVEYADSEAAYEVWESRRDKTANRAKAIASRTMTPSGQSQPSKLQEDANWRALKDAGIF